MNNLKKEEKMIEVIKFGADWCGPCKMFAPILEKIKQNYDSNPESNIDIKSIDIDVDPELASQYNIRSVPTTVFIKEGNVVLKKVGVINADQFDEIIKSL
jgi:thioredoxin 1